MNGRDGNKPEPPTGLVPVVIVGGGPCGLSCSILLSLRGISHVLFERHSSTSIHPKAAGINQRTTEIFRAMGIEEEVYAHAAPAEIASRTAWYTSLGETGREIFSRDAWGGGQYREEYEGYSPSRYCILPQIRLEPILKRRAMELNKNGIFYDTEVVDISNTSESVGVTVRDRSIGQVRHLTASYVVCADGGRSFTDKLGIKWLGEGSLYDMVTAHVRSPIRELHPDPTNFITWFSNPVMGGSTRTGYLYQIGPWPDCLTRPELEEWVFACGRTASDPISFDQESILLRLRETINIPDLSIELLTFSNWTVNALFAEHYRKGRIFLAGDSCHRIPPWGALGMNTGVQDVQNLVWKLELALREPARYDALLDTYERERRDVGHQVGLSSLANMRRHSNGIDKAFGINARQSPTENFEATKAFFDPEHPDHARRKAAVAEASKQLDTEFKAPGFELGWFYPSVDRSNEEVKNHNGQLGPDGTLVHHTYFESTIPGHHLPHVWLQQPITGVRCAIRDLLHPKKLTLFKGQQIKSGGFEQEERTEVIVVGGKTGWREASGKWEAVRGVNESGGVLVRPDGIVAWRGSLDSFSTWQWRALVDRLLLVKP